MLQHVRPNYACQACQANVVISDRLPEAIEKGLPAAGLLAHVAVSKYADHLPLYRQEEIFERSGVELSRSRMGCWMAAVAGLLAPIVKAMLKRVLLSRVVQTDDTLVPVLDHDGKGIKTGRLWVHIGDANSRFIVTTTRPTGAERNFQGFEGFFQASGYSGYDGLFVDGEIVEVGGWMHARRKYQDARTSDPVRLHLMLAWVVGLYEVEHAPGQPDRGTPARSLETGVVARAGRPAEKDR